MRNEGAKANVEKIKYSGMGWKSKIALKRATYGVTINKLVAEGNCLVKGSELYCYLAEEGFGRKIMVVYLDGKKYKEQTSKKEIVQ